MHVTNSMSKVNNFWNYVLSAYLWNVCNIMHLSFDMNTDAENGEFLCLVKLDCSVF